MTRTIFYDWGRDLMAVVQPDYPMPHRARQRLARWLASLRSSSPEEQRHGEGASVPTSAAGDTVNFERFFRRYESRITGYLWRMTGDADVAADLSQDTFVRAWQHFAAISAYPQPQSWLFRVATNLALNHARHRAAAPLTAQFDPASSDPAAHWVERDLVRQVLLALPPKPRALLVLRVVYDLPFADIAAMLSLSPDAAKMALSRAREQFRQLYRRHNGEA